MTAQGHEGLILDGEKTSMAFCPPLPEKHSRIIKAGRPRIQAMSACWRGYVGTWEVKEGRFYLVGLQGGYQLAGSEPLFAEWFSGVLRVPRGKILQYVHMGFGSVYEEEVHIKIEKGMVIKSHVVDNRGKKYDEWSLGCENLPGNENRFPGDDEI